MKMMSTKSKSSRKESKFSKCIKAPMRVLARARDLYVRSLSDCAGHPSIVGYPAPHLTNLPRSLSGVTSSVDSSSDNDLRDLIKAASTTRYQQQKMMEYTQKQSGTAGQVIKRSQSSSVAIGRIDEDAPCEFGQDIKMKTDATNCLYHRNRSVEASYVVVTN